MSCAKHQRQHLRSRAADSHLRVANEDATPVKALRGFDKIMLQPGESKTVEFDLTRRDVSYWNTFAQEWTIAEGTISAMAGFSSRDIKATGSFSPLAGSFCGWSGCASLTSVDKYLVTNSTRLLVVLMTIHELYDRTRLCTHTSAKEYGETMRCGT